MFRKTCLTLVAAFTLVLLTVAPVYATPSMSLGSTASYNLTGRLQVDQSCTADNLAYADQACNGFSSFAISTVYVSIFDNGTCSTSVDPCSFSPAFVNLTQGGTVVWTNDGRLVHDVLSNMTANVGLPGFAGNLTAGSSFQVIFSQPGQYQYFDLHYKWMKGAILVAPTPPPPLPPTATSNHVDLSGNIGWTVLGVGSGQANLNVSHQIGISALAFTPVTESGSFEQSINLSSRVESPGTATSIVRSLLTSLPTILYGATVSTAIISPALQMMLSGQSSSPDYTTWWVNGALSDGSPVQILHGWSSVTGSENLNLGTNIGTRSAWIVTSQFSQTLSVTVPNLNNLLNPSTTKASASLRLLWSYDKSADVLLRNDNTISVTSRSVTPETIYTSCGQYGCIPTSLTVTRNMALTFNLALRLSSTNLQQLSSPSLASTLANLVSALPWIPLGIGGLAAGVAVALILWLTRRTSGTTMPQPPPATTPAAPLATPS